MIPNRSLPTDTLLPHVAYQNVGEAIAWLTKTFGFAEHYRYSDAAGISGAQMHLGNAWIMLKRARAGTSSPAQLGYGTQSPVSYTHLDVYKRQSHTRCSHTQVYGLMRGSSDGCVRQLSQ